MNTCKHCGAPLEPGAKICPNCGAPVEEDRNASSSWIKAEGEKKGSAANGPAPDQTPGPNAPRSKTNRVLTGVLIGLVVVAVAVAGFLLWRSNRHSPNMQNRNPGVRITSAVNGNGGTGSEAAVSADEIKPKIREQKGVRVVSNKVLSHNRFSRYTGLITDKGRTYYSRNGRVQNSFSGIVTDKQGRRWFVSNGRVQYVYSGELTGDDGHTYQVRYGQIVSGPLDVTTAKDTENGTADDDNSGLEFNDYELDDQQYVNDQQEKVTSQKVTAGLSTVKYNPDGSYQVSFYISNGTNRKVRLKRIEHFRLLDSSGKVLSEVHMYDIDGYEMEPGEVAHFEATLPADQNHVNHELTDLRLDAPVTIY